VASDIDIHALYKYLPNSLTQKATSTRKISSAYVFYWGINKEFAALGLHNILFSDDYKRNLIIYFQNNCQQKTLLFINITSKYCKDDAPEGCENWFVMVNVPHNKYTVYISY
jgi:phytoene dehydrogenase-like protein